MKNARENENHCQWWRLIFKLPYNHELQEHRAAFAESTKEKFTTMIDLTAVRREKLPYEQLGNIKVEFVMSLDDLGNFLGV